MQLPNLRGRRFFGRDGGAHPSEGTANGTLLRALFEQEPGNGGEEREKETGNGGCEEAGGCGDHSTGNAFHPACA